MAYAQALEKAWDDVATRTSDEHISVRFLSDVYDLDIVSRRALSVSCNANAKDYITIIVLHYLARKLAFGKLPDLMGEWMDFKELEGGEGYYPAFKKRTIDCLVNKFGSDPDKLFTTSGRMNAKRTDLADVSVTVNPFDDIAMMINITKADEEFGPDANILFDKNIAAIFGMEDIVVMTEIIVHQL